MVLRHVVHGRKQRENFIQKLVLDGVSSSLLPLQNKIHIKPIHISDTFTSNPKINGLLMPLSSSYSTHANFSQDVSKLMSESCKPEYAFCLLSYLTENFGTRVSSNYFLTF
jgi:hypothetical protein